MTSRAFRMVRMSRICQRVMFLIFDQLLPGVVLGSAPADVRDGCAVDSHAAGCASEGEVAVVTENLVGVDLAGDGGAEGVFRNHGGVVDEMAEAALIDHVIR